MKPRLLLISGWSYGRDALEPLARQLGDCCATECFDVNLWFNDEHGQAAWGAELRSALPEATLVAGWSLGAMAALDIMARCPHPRPLVAISSTARFCAGAHYPHGQAPSAVRAMEAALRTHPAKLLEAFRIQCASPHPPLAAAAGHSPAPPEALRRGLAYLRLRDLTEQAASFPLPIRILHGEADSIIPLGAARVSAALPARGRLAAIPNAGHDLPLRHPEWVAEHIRKFLAETT